MSKMPICYFFQTHGTCKEGDKCKFRHTKQQQARFECPSYNNGFCINGPNCKQLHVRRDLCLRYLAGFCPDGPNCILGHPKFVDKNTEVVPTWRSSKVDGEQQLP